MALSLALRACPSPKTDWGRDGLSSLVTRGVSREATGIVHMADQDPLDVLVMAPVLAVAWAIIAVERRRRQ